MKGFGRMISWDWQEMRWKGITMEQIERWEVRYPDINIAQEFNKMSGWLEGHEYTKKAQKKNWSKFIINWLSLAQLKAVL
jgi:hypothetical protein